jgi:hypothetical protein
MTISRSMPSRSFSALAPASFIDNREDKINPLGTILTAAKWPVTACRAILTRPVHKQYVFVGERARWDMRVRRRNAFEWVDGRWVCTCGGWFVSVLFGATEGLSA